MKKYIFIILSLFLLTGCESEPESYKYTNNGNDEGIQCTYFEVGKDLSSGTYKIEHTNFGEQSEQRIYVITVSEEKIDSCEAIDVSNGNMYGGVYDKNGTIVLKDGQYVYITKVLGGTKGHIELIKQ